MKLFRHRHPQVLVDVHCVCSWSAEMTGMMSSPNLGRSTAQRKQQQNVQKGLALTQMNLLSSSVVPAALSTGPRIWESLKLPSVVNMAHQRTPRLNHVARPARSPNNSQCGLRPLGKAQQSSGCQLENLSIKGVTCFSKALPTKGPKQLHVFLPTEGTTEEDDKDKESASVAAVDHLSSSSLDLRQEEDSEKHEHERQNDDDDDEEIQMDENNYEISHEVEREEIVFENEGMSPQCTDILEEDTVLKYTNSEEEINTCVDMAEEENNISLEEKEEEEEEKVPEVAVDLILQHKSDADSKEKNTELKQKDETPHDDKENQEKDLENNMDAGELQLVQETPENINNEIEEMERESSEQYQEPQVIDVNEKNGQDDLIGTCPPEVEKEKSEGCAGISQDVSDPEKGLQEADLDNAKPVENVVENNANQEVTEQAMEPPAHSSAHSKIEAEKRLTPSTSASPLVKIKDEPVDEEYEKALGPQAPAAKVKDEPDTSEEFGQKTSEQIKISAVFSVGGNSTVLGNPAVSAAANPPSNTPPAASLCVVCSGCKKILLKGQTAFQRKGCPRLYCSPRCLYSSTTGSVPTVGSKKTCHYCLKGILNPKDVIIAPVDSNKSVKDFCSQKCLSAFNYKKDSASSALATKCNMCQNLCTIRHEVNFMGTVYKLCSDACFHQFRSSNKLSMNACVTCGAHCFSGGGKGPTLLVDGTSKKFCSQNCVSNFKKVYTKVVPCTMCKVYRTITEMVENINSDGNTELFCSSACVTAQKVQTVSSSGSAVECNHCKKVLVPQYHLAMSDGTIRNFCCFTCVISFQDAFNKTNTQSNQLNVAPCLSTTPVKSATTVQSKAAESSLLSVTQTPSVTNCSCAQCQRSFCSKPELLEFKGRMYVFCEKSCVDEFRRIHYIIAPCVYCKIEKMVKEVKRINNVDCCFCSEGCKLLYKHDLTKRWGKKHCRNCLYCSSTSQTVMTSIFSGKQEEFCGNECLSQYTLLFCEVAKCSMCRRARKMTESVKWLNEIKHFCNLKCLMHFCSQQGCSTIPPGISAKSAPSQVPITIAPVAHSSTTTTTTTTNVKPLAPKEATPVIANVISLSSATNGQPSVLGSAALQGAVPTVVKLLGHASTQTDNVKTPSAPLRILKNKALLCKPMNQNKGTSCKPNTSDINTQTDETSPKVIVLPLPVPVFVPVPMHLYTQLTPHPVGLPVPVPVPMFLPTTLDSAERIVETIQKIKEKIPDNPLEADLIMMAEMVAEDNEKDKAVSQGDQDENFIEDFDLEALSSQLSWEDDSITSTSQWGHASDSEKEKQSPSTPPPQEPQMDLEADFPVAETFEHLENHTQEDKTVTKTRAKTRKRNRDRFSQKKRARKRTEAPQASAASASDVHHPTRVHLEYGVQAWKSWVRWREAQSNVELPKLGSRAISIKEDLLQCSTTELSYGLSKFVTEVRRPNGENYKSDSIYYLCLGIQQHLFENSRMENIFTDCFYNKFSQAVSSLLKDWKPTILPSAQHRRLSFAQVMRCTRSQCDGNKTSCLRFYPPVHKDDKNTCEDTDGVPAKRKKEEEDEVVLEMEENTENPLRCPVRLYEFYLSKCSGEVKQRTSMFYLRPERSCVPNSPLWFSHTPLDDHELESMLSRILTVREIHLEREKPLSVSDPENQPDVD
ncbi:Zinc finger MYM-type protein 4 [Bagarius yarrelli]|uniref:Zinc finger MYM-type protein 4 n=1 Tax=Bagarius yarrelli TaxID=175774 RepID=A0A556TNW2_BAGYA|nr:Zinc finger MYM-type protein 4 [Bagarius yarrelli]